MNLALFPHIGPDHSGGREALDRYYTPPDLARRLVSLLPIEHGQSVVEPSAGAGAFARPLLERTPAVACMDIDPNAPLRASWVGPWRCGDFLQRPYVADWTVGNPPYIHAEEHTRHALEHSTHVAFLLRLAFLESAGRVSFWSGVGGCLRKLWVLAERPSFTSDGKTDSAAYGFFWWDRNHTGPAEVVPGFSWKGADQ